ncbi:MAG: hypothetical protein KUG79_13925 [Pseudomonadales bacterium]|nr:hypothetical protein [Pseudomonadales bacterium]
MKVVRLLDSTESTGGPSAGSRVVIDTPVDVNGRTIYRNSYILKFNLDPTTDGIVVDQENTLLTGDFKPCQIHLNQTDTNYQLQDWQASDVTAGANSDLIKVRLTHPFRLVRVNSYDSRGVEVLRLDGEAVSDEPTIFGNANAPFSAEFIGRNFALRRVTPFNVALGLNFQSVSKLDFSEENAKQKMQGEYTGSTGAGGKSDVSKNNGGKQAAVNAFGIKNIELQSYPTGPRVLLGKIGALVDSETALTRVWQVAGEQTEPATALLSTAQQAEVFSNQLQNLCDDYFNEIRGQGLSPAAEVFLPIVFESDTPAHLHFGLINIEYSMLRNHFDNIDTKQNIKFDGRTLEHNKLNLSLPPLANIRKAEVEINISMSAVSGLGQNAGLIASLDKNVGVRAAGDVVVCRKITPTNAFNSDTVAIAVMPLSPNVNITVQIIEAINGGPNGALLGSASLTAEFQNNQQWVVAAMDKTVLLDTADYWLCVSCTEGEMLWLGQSGVAEEVILGPTTVTNSAATTTQLRTTKITTIAPLYEFGLSQGNVDFSQALAMQVGEVSAELMLTDGAKLKYDFAVGLNQLLGTHSEDAAAAVIVGAASAGSITVYPPAITYDFEPAG